MSSQQIEHSFEFPLELKLVLLLFLLLIEVIRGRFRVARSARIKFFTSSASGFSENSFTICSVFHPFKYNKSFAHDGGTEIELINSVMLLSKRLFTWNRSRQLNSTYSGSFFILEASANIESGSWSPKLS